MANITLTIPDALFHTLLLSARERDTTVSALATQHLIGQVPAASPQAIASGLANLRPGPSAPPPAPQSQRLAARVLTLQDKLLASQQRVASLERQLIGQVPGPKAPPKIITKTITKTVYKERPVAKRQWPNQVAALRGHRAILTQHIKDLRKRLRASEDTLSRILAKQLPELSQFALVRADSARNTRKNLILRLIDEGLAPDIIAKQANCSRYNVHYYIRKFRPEKRNGRWPVQSNTGAPHDA